jgi:hypothetical protein
MPAEIEAAVYRAEAPMRSAWAKFIALAFIAIAAVSPVAFLDQIPLVDAPNHLARFHIMQTISTDPDLAKYYYVKGGFYPYFGMRIIYEILTPVVGVERAGHIFALVAILLPCFGSLALSKAIHGRLSVLSFAAFAFSMNMIAGWGFLNFLLSLGVVLFAFAGWIGLRDFKLPWRVAGFGPIIFATGCVHLISAGILFSVIAAYEYSQATRGKSFFAISRPVMMHMASVSLLALAIVPLLLLVSTEELGYKISYFGVVERLEMFVSPFLLGSDKNVHTEAALALGMFLLFYVAFRENVVGLKEPYGRLLVVLSFAAALSPAIISGVYGTHFRLPLLIVLILIAAMEVKPGRGNTLLAKVLAGLLMVITGVHLFSCSLILRQQDLRITELRRALQVIDRGAKVLPALYVQRDPDPSGPPLKSLFHLASYAVVDRSAFVPTLFGMYEIGAREAYRPMFPFQANPALYKSLLPEPLDPLKQPQQWSRPELYDFILVFNITPDAPILPGSAVVHSGSYFKILKVSR